MRPTIRRSPDAYMRLQQAIEWPMLTLAVVFAIAYLLPSVATLSAEQERTAQHVMFFVWAAFAAEYAALFALAPDRRQMVLTHKLDLLLIVLPMLRPLRLLRLLMVGAAAGRATVALRRVTGRPGFQSFLLVAGAIIVAGAGLVYAVERNAPGSTFQGPADALWWAIVTATTVGYGDHFPTTPEGRGVAVLLMLVGIGLFSVVTANVAAYFVESDVEDRSQAEVLERLERIEELLRVSRGAADSAAAGSLSADERTA